MSSLRKRTENQSRRYLLPPAPARRQKKQSSELRKASRPSPRHCLAQTTAALGAVAGAGTTTLATGITPLVTAIMIATVTAAVTTMTTITATGVTGATATGTAGIPAIGDGGQTVTGGLAGASTRASGSTLTTGTGTLVPTTATTLGVHPSRS